VEDVVVRVVVSCRSMCDVWEVVEGGGVDVVVNGQGGVIRRVRWLRVKVVVMVVYPCPSLLTSDV